LKVLSSGGNKAWMRHKEAGDVAEAADDVLAQHFQLGMLESVYLQNSRRLSDTARYTVK